MSERILVINASPRRGGNCDLLCDALIAGAQGSGKQTKKLCVDAYALHPCKACMYCVEHVGECCQKDDWRVFFEAFDWCDAVVFATPIYYYSVSAQLKILFDRCYMRNKKREFGFKKAAFVAVSAAKAESAVDTAYASFRGWLRCVGEVAEGGTVFACGYKEKGAVAGGAPLEQARALGRVL
ncbi:flavodoxin family protein [Butyricicoccus sp.]|uniref:flavodoxin family protein n=1 Tax=Butyricicoccus sp. TaxID=2049021 RepID=UPI003F174443